MSPQQTKKDAAPTAARDGLQETIDALSLEQALLDADVAINRSHDLMLRLVELRAQLAEERAEKLALQAQLEESEARYVAVIGNRAYKLAHRVWSIRQAIGV
jgi:hypothetical protein